MLRLAIAVLAMAATGGLQAASCERAAADHLTAAPTQLDYIVLASLADSPQLLSMAAYRPSR